MLTDIYMTIPGEKTYDSNALEQFSSLQILLSQIKMILYTLKGSVLGYPDFGFNLEDYLFLYNLSASELKTKMIQSIYQYCPDAQNYNVDVQISFYPGVSRDVCLIDIFIDNQKLLGIGVK